MNAPIQNGIAEPMAIFVRFQSEQEVEVTPYQIKGAIISKMPDHPLVPFIDGSYREQLKYPRVQVKVLRKQFCVFGLGEGYAPVRSLPEQITELEIDGKKLEFNGAETPESVLNFDQEPDTFLRYKFISPWVALNHRSLLHYSTLLPHERVTFLNRLLVQNLLFIARELDYVIPFNLSGRVKLQSLSPRVVEQQGSGSFKGYFTCNMHLPDYLGLGNGITKGLGTIVRI